MTILLTCNIDIAHYLDVKCFDSYDMFYTITQIGCSKAKMMSFMFTSHALDSVKLQRHKAKIKIHGGGFKLTLG